MDDTDAAAPAPEDVPSAPPERQLSGEAAGIPPAGPRPIGQGWLRALLMLFAVVAAQGVTVALLLVLNWLSGHPAIGIEDLQSSPALLFAVNVPSIAVILAGWHWVDRGSLAQLGHPGPPTRILRNVVLGTIGGVALMSVIVAIGVASGGWSLSFEPRDGPAAWIGWTPVLLLAAYFEELLLRGYVLQNLGRRRPMLGLVASSLVFAALHLGNPNADSGGAAFTALLTLNIVLAGLLLGLLFLRSGDLWLPLGVHFGWNWAQGVLFGLPVSGVTIPSIGQGEVLERGLLTGTAFGPESSLIAALVTGLVAAGCLWSVARRGLRLPVTAPAAPDSA